MKICLISVEIFAWGKHGGFGRATRIIGRELVKRGHEVSALVPRRAGQKSLELLDGIKVYGFSPWWPFDVRRMLREIDADIFHSCEPSYTTYLAMRDFPDKKHVVTIRDPRDREDWKLEFERPSLNKLQVIHNYWFENNPKVRRCIKDMDAVYTTARYLVPKVRHMYALSRDPEFLPTPVEVPLHNRKASTPTVCYVARLDRRKRPELFLELAAKFPDVNFVIMGKSRNRGHERQLQAADG
ncbi:MAG: glycosyltransferase, partial [Lysobacterales bacterium]